MSPAEYRTIREACGLSQQAAAAFHNVSLRTVQHWEEGRNKVPAGVSEELRGLDARIERAVSEVIGLHEDLKARRQAPDIVHLIRYRSAATYAGSRADQEGMLYPCHNALIGRMRIALQRVGISVRIDWDWPTVASAGNPP